jgi:multicomponent Na+:H+ antiporter subunit C
MLSKHVIRILLGVAIFGNAVNLLIFTTGRVMREVAAIIPQGGDQPTGLVANPLPQALILTAIVISFSFFAFLLVLAYRAYQELGTDDTDGMRVAEPQGEPLPPIGY